MFRKTGGTFTISMDLSIDIHSRPLGAVYSRENQRSTELHKHQRQITSAVCDHEAKTSQSIDWEVVSGQPEKHQVGHSNLMPKNIFEHHVWDRGYDLSLCSNVYMQRFISHFLARSLLHSLRGLLPFFVLYCPQLPISAWNQIIIIKHFTDKPNHKCKRRTD